MWSRERKAAQTMFETPKFCSSASPASHRARSWWLEGSAVWGLGWELGELLPAWGEGSQESLGPGINWDTCPHIWW